MDNHNEGPGSAVVVAYAVMVAYGFVLGVAVGWWVWGRLCDA